MFEYPPRPSIGIDIDGVLVYDQWREFLEFMMIAEGIPCDVDCYLRTNCWEQATGLESIQVGEYYTRFRQSRWYQPAQPIGGAAEGLRQLDQWYDLHVVTARSGLRELPTLGELATHFSGVNFASHRFNGYRGKGQLMTECGASLLIEDNVKIAVQVAAVAPVILFPQPANVHFAPHDHLIYPSTAHRAHDGLTHDEWCALWQETWQEIVLLVRDVVPLAS